MRKQLQSHIIAFLGTVLSLALIFLLLWFLKINAPTQLEDEGIVLTFGDAELGGGSPEAAAMDEITQVQQIPAPTLAARPSTNDLMVQDQEESLVLAKQAEEQAKRNAEQEELLRRRKEEMARQEAERIAKEKVLAEQKAKEQEAIDKANRLAAALGSSGTAEGANGEATSAGSGAGMGNPVGKSEGQVVNSDKDNAYVPGRSVKDLPKPSSNFKQDGDVVVRIWVDQGGNVTNAQAIGGSISDLATRRLAVQAALKAKFTPGDTPQIGEVTYIFKLK